MSDVFFIADTHFGHRGILRYEPEKRPFADVNDMNESMACAWNKVVGPNDKVFHLGDVAFSSRALDWVKALNGRKILIAGNHDNYPTERFLEVGFEKVLGALQFESLILTHIPVHPSELRSRFYANIHGHLHSRSVNDGNRYVCVSAEQCTNLAPISYEEVLSRATDIHFEATTKFTRD